MIDKITNIMKNVFEELNYNIIPKIVKSSRTECDYQCDDCFKLAKEYKESPFDIGNEIVNKINNIANFNEYFKEVSFANPGFINIIVSDKLICDSLNELMNKERLGATLENKKIIVDYGGPNIAKPLHVGHLRSAIVGQSINNILKFKGNKTVSDVHLGDIGLQIGEVIYGVLNDFKDVNINDINFDLDYLNVTYPRISALCKENEIIKQNCEEITKQMQEGREDYKTLWQKICEVSITDIKRIYKYLSVDFDLWLGESDAFKWYGEVLPFIEKTGVIKIDDGAKIIDVKEETDKTEIPPCLIQKTNGAYLYATSDLGTIWQRKKEYNPDEIIYITDARQSMHFIQVFRVCKKTKLFNGKLMHIGFGTVNGKDNKPFKTRNGGSFKLEDLIVEVKNEFINSREDNKNMASEDLDIIVNSIIKFADLQNDLERNYIFDINKFCEVTGKTGPYILYTYLRINKIINNKKGMLSDNIYSESDRNLRLKILSVSETINMAALERKPHYIAEYLYNLATLSNNFYQNNRISDLEGIKKEDFEILLSYNNKVMKTLLKLLGIDIPTKM